MQIKTIEHKANLPFSGFQDAVESIYTASADRTCHIELNLYLANHFIHRALDPVRIPCCIRQ